MTRPLTKSLINVNTGVSLGVLLSVISLMFLIYQRNASCIEALSESVHEIKINVEVLNQWRIDREKEVEKTAQELVIYRQEMNTRLNRIEEKIDRIIGFNGRKTVDISSSPNTSSVP